MNRLTSAVASTGTSYYYSYDADGNRTCAQTTGTCTTTPYSYNNADELTTGPAGNYTYDARRQRARPAPNLPPSAYNTKNQTATITPSGERAPRIMLTPVRIPPNARPQGQPPSPPTDENIYQTSTAGTPTYDTYDSNGDLIGFRTGGTSYYLLHDNIGSIVAVITVHRHHHRPLHLRPLRKTSRNVTSQASLTPGDTPAATPTPPPDSPNSAPATTTPPPPAGPSSTPHNRTLDISTLEMTQSTRLT